MPALLNAKVRYLSMEGVTATLPVDHILKLEMKQMDVTSTDCACIVVKRLSLPLIWNGFLETRV